MIVVAAQVIITYNILMYRLKATIYMNSINEWRVISSKSNSIGDDDEFANSLLFIISSQGEILELVKSTPNNEF